MRCQQANLACVEGKGVRAQLKPNSYLGSRRPFASRLQTSRQKVGRSTRSRGTLMTRAEGAIKDGELISSEEEFLKKVSDRKEAIIVDWMAKWCRKCIYLKPKLERLVREEFPGLQASQALTDKTVNHRWMDLVFIDVNSIPGNLVYGHGIQKMPTITIYKEGEKVREHIAAEAAPRAIANIKNMISEYLELNPQEKQLIASG